MICFSVTKKRKKRIAEQYTKVWIINSWGMVLVNSSHVCCAIVILDWKELAKSPKNANSEGQFVRGACKYVSWLYPENVWSLGIAILWTPRWLFNRMLYPKDSPPIVWGQWQARICKNSNRHWPWVTAH